MGSSMMVERKYDASRIRIDIALDGGTQPSVTAVAPVHVTFCHRQNKSPCVSTWSVPNCTLWHKSLISMHVELINLCMQMECPVSQNQSTGNLCREAAQVVWQKVMNEIWIRIVGEIKSVCRYFFFCSSPPFPFLFQLQLQRGWFPFSACTLTEWIKNDTNSFGKK